MNIRKLVQEEIEKQLGLVEENCPYGSAMDVSDEIVEFLLNGNRIASKWELLNLDIMPNYPLKENFEVMIKKLHDFFKQLPLNETFLQYFNDFYGRKGVYQNTENKDLTMDDLRRALKILYRKRPKYGFAGDSTDRELLRDILIDEGVLTLINESFRR